MTRARCVLALLWWVGAVLLGLRVLAVLGRTTFPTPPADDLDALLRWSTTTPPLLAAGSCVRLAATAMGWYLLATTVGGVVGRLLGLRRTVHLLDRVSLPVVRRLASRAVGIGLVAQLGLLTGAGATPVPQPAVPTEVEQEVATMAVLPDEPTSTTTMHALPDEPTSTTTMRALPDEPTSTTTMRALPDEPVAPATWTVRPGDHLWRISEVLLALDLGHQPSDGQVDAYLQMVVATNQQVLPNPDDPDLLLPGLRLTLPEPGR